MLANVTLMFEELFTCNCVISSFMLIVIKFSRSTLPCLCLLWPPLCPLLLSLCFLTVFIVSMSSLFISFILNHFLLYLHQHIIVVSYFCPLFCTWAGVDVLSLLYLRCWSAMMSIVVSLKIELLSASFKTITHASM